MIQLPFADRAEAGRLLAADLDMLKLPVNPIVLALPRGGLPLEKASGTARCGDRA
jgi:predicted phosphoribosyltransferase